MKAGLLRRGAAFMVDIWVATVPAMAVLWLPGVWIPMDRGASWVFVPGVLLVLAAFAYIYLGCALLPNSYGRWLMGIRVVDAASGGRPRRAQALKRSLTTGLWPVEAALILFSRSGRRLGDHWARTGVVRAVSEAPAWKRLAPLGGAVVTAGLIVAAMPAIVARMGVVVAAAAYARDELRAEPVGRAGYVEVRGDSGNVALRLPGDRYVRVYLARDGAVWRARRAERIGADVMGGGFSIQ